MKKPKKTGDPGVKVSLLHVATQVCHPYNAISYSKWKLDLQPPAGVPMRKQNGGEEGNFLLRMGPFSTHITSAHICLALIRSLVLSSKGGWERQTLPAWPVTYSDEGDPTNKGKRENGCRGTLSTNNPYSSIR